MPHTTYKTQLLSVTVTPINLIDNVGICTKTVITKKQEFDQSECTAARYPEGNCSLALKFAFTPRDGELSIEKQ